MFTIWFPHLVSMKSPKANQSPINIEQSVWFLHLVSQCIENGGNQIGGDVLQFRMNRSGCLVSYLVSAVSGFLPFCPFRGKGKPDNQITLKPRQLQREPEDEK